MMQKARPNSKFQKVKSRTDTGIKKTILHSDDGIKVTKLKGENFGRITHNVLSKYIYEGCP